MLLFTSCNWFKFEFCFAQRALRTVKIGLFVIFVIIRFLVKGLNSETGLIQQTQTNFESCHKVFR